MIKLQIALAKALMKAYESTGKQKFADQAKKILDTIKSKK